MGTWGHGNFQNDRALDYLGDLIGQLTTRIENAFQGTRLDPDELGETVLVPSVNIITTLCKEFGAIPPASTTVQLWKTRYLQNWDATIDGLDPDDDYKIARRQTIVETFDALIKIADSF